MGSVQQKQKEKLSDTWNRHVPVLTETEFSLYLPFRERTFYDDMICFLSYTWHHERHQLYNCQKADARQDII